MACYWVALLELMMAEMTAVTMDLMMAEMMVDMMGL
jgi:hypothetical protein